MDHRLDIVGRLELLNGMADQYRSRLLVLDRPSAQLDHADRLEQRGRELIAAAERIRSAMFADAQSRSTIERELVCCLLEIQILRSIRLGRSFELRNSARTYVEKFVASLSQEDIEATLRKLS